MMDDTRAHTQDIRPLKIVVLNLMPLKITTETDLIRLLSNTPLQMEICFMKLKSHTPKNTPVEHMMMFYKDFDELRLQKFDGMIITGAPVEQMPFEEVNYWKEVTTIFDWARTHVTSTLISVGRHKPDYITSMVCPSIRCRKRNSVYFSSIRSINSCRYSVVLMMCFICRIADIRK